MRSVSGHLAQLHHLDLAFGLGRQRLHDRRLNQGYERHVGIRRDGDSTEQVWRQFTRDVDCRWAVGPADDADSGRIPKREICPAK